jgi:hypothetical protein
LGHPNERGQAIVPIKNCWPYEAVFQKKEPVGVLESVDPRLKISTQTSSMPLLRADHYGPHHSTLKRECSSQKPSNTQYPKNTGNNI